MLGRGELEGLDGALSSLAREETALRLRLGQLLEVLGRGAVFDLGFSSLGAYAVERCERSVRWAEGARGVARRVEALPELRRAMAQGKVSWSMGELLARVATPEDEERWLERAESRTVRQVRRLVDEALAAARRAAVCSGVAREEAAPVAAARENTASGAARERAVHDDAAAARKGAVHSAATRETAAPDDPARPARPREQLGTAAASAAAAEGNLCDAQDGDLEEACILTCTVAREDAWLFEATRALLEHLGVHGSAAQSEALLAEAQGTLLDALPPGTVGLAGSQGCAAAQQRWAEQRRWVEQLRRWRLEAEVSCEKKLVAELLASRRASGGFAGGVLGAAFTASLGMGALQPASCTTLDRQVRAVAAALARHELELSRLVLRFHRADGWRRLGYATEAQYARERLGLSHSSLLARRSLALRLEKLPAVAAALGAAQIGVEAALQLVRVATPRTEAAWLDRARRRTLKHLREEVAAASMAVRLSGESDCLPPEDAELTAFQALEQAVVSGQLGQPRAPGGPSGPSTSPPAESPCQDTARVSRARRPWRVMLGSLAAWLARGLQVSAAAPVGGAGAVRSSAGRVTLRLRMSRELYLWWRGLESQARRWLPAGMGWLRFLCLSLWGAWRHLLGADVAYGHIYVRDRFRCTSPVCNRRDVTPHHLRFRSAGGSDEDHNITSPCTWCHLHGVHGGRIRATGPASHIRWELGPKGAPCLVVQGRERVAA